MIKDHAPDAIKLGEIKNHFGRKVAIVRDYGHKSPWEDVDISFRMRTMLISCLTSCVS